MSNIRKNMIMGVATLSMVTGLAGNASMGVLSPLMGDSAEHSTFAKIFTQIGVSSADAGEGEPMSSAFIPDVPTPPLPNPPITNPPVTNPPVTNPPVPTPPVLNPPVPNPPVTKPLEWFYTAPGQDISCYRGPLSSETISTYCPRPKKACLNSGDFTVTLKRQVNNVYIYGYSGKLRGNILPVVVNDNVQYYLSAGGAYVERVVSGQIRIVNNVPLNIQQQYPEQSTFFQAIDTVAKDVEKKTRTSIPSVCASPIGATLKIVDSNTKQYGYRTIGVVN